MYSMEMIIFKNVVPVKLLVFYNEGVDYFIRLFISSPKNSTNISLAGYIKYEMCFFIYFCILATHSHRFYLGTLIACADPERFVRGVQLRQCFF